MVGSSSVWARSRRTLPDPSPPRKGVLVLLRLPAERPGGEQPPTARAGGKPPHRRRPKPPDGRGGGHPERLQGVGGRRGARADRAKAWVQLVGEPGEVRADQLRPRGKPAQPPPHRRRRQAEPGGDRPVALAGRLGEQRPADHLGEVQPAGQRSHRQRLRRTRTRRATPPSRSQRRVPPQGRSTPAHLGQTSPPATRARSTRAGSGSTISTGAPHRTGRALPGSLGPRREGAGIFSNGANSNTGHDKGQPKLWAAPSSSSPSVSRQARFMAIQSVAQQPAPTSRLSQ